jgi:hypothetical protein
LLFETLRHREKGPSKGSSEVLKKKREHGRGTPQEEKPKRARDDARHGEIRWYQAPTGREITPASKVGSGR